MDQSKSPEQRAEERYTSKDGSHCGKRAVVLMSNRGPYVMKSIGMTSHYVMIGDREVQHATDFDYAKRLLDELNTASFNSSEPRDKMIQELVDAMEGTKRNVSWWREHPSESWIHDALAKAKDQFGIVPTNP